MSTMTNTASNRSNNTYNFKIVLLGEGCVGKTSLLLRYIEDKFNDRHLTTIQASFLNKKINLLGKHVNLSIWDTAGQEKFHALGPIYYRSSNGAILVYDITDLDSFQKVKNWVKELKKVLGSDIGLIITGNKIDLEKERNVNAEEAEKYAASVGATHFHTSAKLNQGIEDLFLELAKQMITRSDINAQSAGNSRSPNRVLVVEDDHIRPKQSCCGGASNSNT